MHSNSVSADVEQKESLCDKKPPGSITNLFHKLGRFLLIGCSCCIYVLLQQIQQWLINLVISCTNNIQNSYFCACVSTIASVPRPRSLSIDACANVIRSLMPNSEHQSLLLITNADEIAANCYRRGLEQPVDGFFLGNQHGFCSQQRKGKGKTSGRFQC